MSIRAGDRVSFTLSGLSREQQNTRRRTTGEDVATRSAAAVAGACADVEAPGYEEEDGGGVFVDTRVDAKREAPPRLKGRRTFCTTIVTLWTICTLCVATGVVLNLLSSRFFDKSDSDKDFERRLARDETIRDKVFFGVWDSQRAVTQLQLQVSVSMALGVRAEDGDIKVEGKDNYFFEIEVHHATVEEVEYISSLQFVERLNSQLSYYGGIGVLSKPPRLIKNTTA
jgi:hypothetical protein